MNSAVCTLFEGDYSYGLGALLNSLASSGFRGVIWVGYRGRLPPWVSRLHVGILGEEFYIGPECLIRFIRLDTSLHLTNYKPQFMSHVLDCDSDIEVLFYFDPDIVTKCSWSFFEEWSTCGIALVEDINSPLPENHPRRCAWRRVFAQNAVPLHFTTERYVNGGFVGITRANRPFLDMWLRAQDIIGKEVGGLEYAGLDGTGDPRDNPENPFGKTDQDALNAAVEASSSRLSIVGKEGMDFEHGGFIMSHAIGGRKPWRKKFLWAAINGIGPTDADRGFLKHCQTPISLYSSTVFRQKQVSLRLASMVGRFIRRS